MAFIRTGGTDYKLIGQELNIGYPTSSTTVKVGILTKGYSSISLRANQGSWTLEAPDGTIIGSVGTTAQNFNVSAYDYVLVPNSSSANLQLYLTYVS